MQVTTKVGEWNVGDSIETVVVTDEVTRKMIDIITDKVTQGMRDEGYTPVLVDVVLKVSPLIRSPKPSPKPTVNADDDIVTKGSK